MNQSRTQTATNESSLNEDEMLNYIAENRLEKGNAARINKKIIERNIPKAINQIANYLEVLRTAFAKLTREKSKQPTKEARPVQSRPSPAAAKMKSEPVFDYRPLKTIANCLKYIEDNSLDLSSCISPVSLPVSNPILMMEQYKSGAQPSEKPVQTPAGAPAQGENIPDINVSAIVPAADESVTSGRNGDFSDCLGESGKAGTKPAAAERSKDSPIPAPVEEPIIERYSEEGSLEQTNTLQLEAPESICARVARTAGTVQNVQPLQVPAELMMDSSQESLCRTEEKELEQERQNFVKSLEKDLRRRPGLAEELTAELSGCDVPEKEEGPKDSVLLQNEQQINVSVKNTARFASADNESQPIIKAKEAENDLHCAKEAVCCSCRLQQEKPSAREKENTNGSNNTTASTKSRNPGANNSVKVSLRLGKCGSRTTLELAQTHTRRSRLSQNCPETLTFREPAETDRQGKSQSSYKGLLETIEEKKQLIKRLRKQETEESVALRTIIIAAGKSAKAKRAELRAEKARARLAQLRASIVQQENNVKYLIKLARDEATKFAERPECATARQFSSRTRKSSLTAQQSQHQLEKKYSDILHVRGKTACGGHLRTSRSYTITERLQSNLTRPDLASFVSAKAGNTPNFSRSKIVRSRIFSPTESTPGTAKACSVERSQHQQSQRSHEAGVKPFQDCPAMFVHQTCRDPGNRSLCHPKDAVELLLEGYQKAFGQYTHDEDKLVAYWKTNVSSKALVYSQVFFNARVAEQDKKRGLVQGDEQGVVTVDERLRAKRAETDPAGHLVRTRASRGHRRLLSSSRINIAMHRMIYRAN